MHVHSRDCRNINIQQSLGVHVQWLTESSDGSIWHACVHKPSYWVQEMVNVVAVQNIGWPPFNAIRIFLISTLQKGYGNNKAQKGFTWMWPGMEGCNYVEKLVSLGLFSLKRRQLRGDLIEVYKIVRGIDKINGQSLFSKAGESRDTGLRWES